MKRWLILLCLLAGIGKSNAQIFYLVTEVVSLFGYATYAVIGQTVPDITFF